MRRNAWSFDLFGIAALALFFFLAGCGQPNNSPSAGGVATPMAASGPCSQAFLDDYRAFRNYSQTEYDRTRVTTAAQGFKQKYAGTRCTADDFDYTTYQQRSYTIDVNWEMDAIINQSLY